MDEIVWMLNERRAEFGRLLQVNREVRDTVNGDIAIPLPELDSTERSPIANLPQLALDGTAQRVASTEPDVQCPSERPDFIGHDKRAEDRRRAILGWRAKNAMDLKRLKRARHLIGYGSTPVLIRPNPELMIPKWEIRDPLMTFPAARGGLDDMEPDNVIFVFTRSVEWLRKRYPEPMSRLRLARGTRADTHLELVEYVDGDEFVLGVLGENASEYGSPSLASQAGAYRDSMGSQGGQQRNVVVGGQLAGGRSMAVEVERTVNAAGVCTAVVPGRITLDRLTGQLDGMLGQHLTAARLTSLELIAIEEGVWPKTWLVARDNGNPEIITMADGRAGVLGEVRGGEIVVTQVNPGYKTNEMIDRLTEAQRAQGSAPPEMQGQASSNIRTGRRGDQVLGAAIDYGIAENQKILARSEQHEIERGIAISKALWGPKTISFYVSTKGARGHVSYVPNDTFTTDEVIVKYAHAGVDEGSQIIQNGQRLGTRQISLKTARRMDPAIDDPDFEEDQVMVEALDMAMLGGVTTQAQSGQMPIPDIAAIQLELSKKRTLAEAITHVHELAQKRQATSADAGGPADPNGPEAQPGLAAPGQGAEAGTDQIPPVGPSAQHLQGLLASLQQVQSAQRPQPAPAPG